MKMGTLRRFQVGNKHFWELFSFSEVSDHKFIEAQNYLPEIFSSSSQKCRRKQRSQAIRPKQGWPLNGVSEVQWSKEVEEIV